MINRIDELVLKSKADIIDLSWHIYQLIKEKSKPWEGLQYLFVTYYNAIESSEEFELESHYTEEDKRALKKQYGRIVDRMLISIQSNNMAEGDFYHDLWDRVINGSFFTTDKERVFALYYIWIDKRIPYFQLSDGRKMSNETYSNYIDKISDSIKKMIYILNASSITQKTERASLILKIMQNLGSEDEQIVFLSRIITEIQDDNESRRSLLRDMLKDIQ